MQRVSKTHSRGISLVEAIVALAVMAVGMLAVAGVQSTLRLNADVAKQRTEATLIAQDQMEADRSFTLVEAPTGTPSWSTIVSDVSPREVTGLNAVYRVQRTVTYDEQPAKVLRVTVTWNDRSGAEQRVELNSSIAAAAPALSGTLAVRPGTSPVAPVRRPYQRHPTIPVQARDFGDGRSAFVPPFRPWLVLVFNNVTGLVTGICEFPFDDTSLSNETVTPDDVSACANNTLAQLLSGFVRFVRDPGGPDLTAADVENPTGPALRFRMQLNLTSTGHPTGSFCFDDANYETTFDGLLPFGAYYCVIKSNTGGLWSGRSFIEAQRTHVGTVDVDWVISGTAADNHYRVCRYTPAANDAQAVANVDHPRNYADVNGNLVNQNFVVVPATKTCPTDVAANPSIGDLVNSNTLQHQPTPP